jgi:hypothetical protein
MKTSILFLTILLTPPLAAQQPSSFGMKDAVDSSTRAVKTVAYTSATVFFTYMAGLFCFTNTTEWLEVTTKLKSHRKPLDSYTIAQMQTAFTHSVAGVFALKAALYSAKKAKEAIIADKKESE